MRKKDPTVIGLKKKPFKKILNIIKKIILGVLSVAVICLVISSILHASYYQNKFNKLKPNGQMVDVFDGQMHLLTMGNGDKTIVLLPGLGTPLPSADFAPLMRSLSDEYTVVCIEFFGYGFSTTTQRERTCDNFVEEIRQALTGAGLQGPYVLMPHSISGLYSEYYAAKYPEEVEAIVSLDSTSSAYTDYPEMKGMQKVLNFVVDAQQVTGLTSVLGSLNTSIQHKTLTALGYTDDELYHQSLFQGFFVNKNLKEQMKYANNGDYCRCVNETTYPVDKVPYYKFISTQTYETDQPMMSISSKQYHMDHLSRVGALDSYTILKGQHYIYHDAEAEIVRITKEFLNSLGQ